MIITIQFLVIKFGDLNFFVNISYNKGVMVRYFLWLLVIVFLFPKSVSAQGFNIASTYPIDDQEAVSGDILISSLGEGLVRTNVTYDNKIFGVLQDNPLVVFREATPSGNVKPIIRTGDALVNVNDFNGEVKKGEFVTTSPQSGKGMKAGQSGYVLGIAIDDAKYSDQTTTVEDKSVRGGTVNVALRVEYAELTTARNNIRLLNDLNTALFRTVKDPERFTLIIRYLLSGMIALAAFSIGFFAITRSVSHAIEAIGRNPLAKNSILLSVSLQMGVTVIVALGTIVIIFLLIRL